MDLTPVDLIVGIPSYNEADSISFPTAQADEGLTRYFPDKTAVIINCDNHSADHTREAFLSTPTQTPKLYLSTPEGVQGKGNNLKNLFQKALELQAKAVVVVDADLKSITPQWIKQLAGPLFEGFHFVSPLYARHKHEGPITYGIAYPLTRALYGRRIRQPTGGDFGFRGELAKVYLESPIWGEAMAHHGIDIWMTTVAIQQKVPLCQAFLGSAKIHRTKDKGSALESMFRQVVGTLFSLMVFFDGVWSQVKYSRPTAISGLGSNEMEIPPRKEVVTLSLRERFHEGFEHYQPVWKEILGPNVLTKLFEIRAMKEGEFNFPADLWAMLLFDMAIAYRDSFLDQTLILDSLIPLYLGKTLSFVTRTASMSPKKAEEIIEEDCLTFELAKPYLMQRWMEGKKDLPNKGV